MGRGIGVVQKRVLSVLEELTRRCRKDWFHLDSIIVFLYYPHQIDPNHIRNVGRLGKFVEDWSHTKNQHRRIWESCRTLERRGYLEIRITKKIKTTWGGRTRWMECRLKRKEKNI